MHGITTKKQFDRAVAGLKQVLASVRFDPSEALAYQDVPGVEHRRVTKGSNISKNAEDKS
ncbi:MAG TPA: hypothetical protein PK344_16660 [Syntrophorhabdaceae bacterium]|jgi:hypothetical protein|nr:hypothetical protein [Syntrophorhabdaceae bacterium]